MVLDCARTDKMDYFYIIYWYSQVTLCKQVFFLTRITPYICAFRLKIHAPPFYSSQTLRLPQSVYL